MERNNFNDQSHSRRFQPGQDRNQRWAEDDDRDDRRYSREDSEQDRFSKHTRGAPYSTYGSRNGSGMQGSERYASHSNMNQGEGRDWGHSEGVYNSSESFRDHDMGQGYGRNQYTDRSRATSSQAGNHGNGYGTENSFPNGGSYPGSESATRGMYSNQQGNYGSQGGSLGSHQGSRYGMNSGLSQGSPYGNSYGSSQGYGAGSGSQGFNPNSSYGKQDYAMGSDYSQQGFASSGLSQNANRSSMSSQNTPWAQNSKSGRGPKGYKRSDERMKEEISDLFTHHHEIDPSEVEIQVASGEVTLTGTVDDRQEKRLAEDLASSISGVTEVHNQIRVVSSQNQARDGKEVRSSANEGKSQDLKGLENGSARSSGSNPTPSNNGKSSVQ